MTEERAIYDVGNDNQRAVATRRPFAVASTKGIQDIEGFENVEPEDLIIPRLMLVQPVSRLGDDAVAGQFWNNLTEECQPEINAVILRLVKTRVHWDPTDLSAGPVCASNDNRVPREPLTAYLINGVPHAEYMLQERYNSEFLGRLRTDWPTMAEWAEQFEQSLIFSCDVCPFGDIAWQMGAPPPCSLTYCFLGVDRGDGDFPFLVSLRRTSAKSARRYITTLGFRHKAFYVQPTRITSEKVADERGVWYVAKMTPGPAFEGEELAKYMSLYRALAGVPVEAETESYRQGEFGAEPEEIPF